MRSTSLTVLMAAGVLLLAGCGGGPAEGGGSSPTAGSSDSPTASAVVVDAHPFTVGAVPQGWAPVIAGRGTAEQRWGDDFAGTIEPFTVLDGPAGATATVSVTGYAGYESGLSQAAAGYGRTAQETDVDGVLAYFTPGSDRRWADLVVARGEDLAVRASSPDASRDELAALVQAAEPAADHAQAPTVSDPPPGWSVVGSVDADVVLALFSTVVPGSGTVPGPSSAYVAGWAGADGSLSALSLPSDAVDLAALDGQLQEITGHAVDVAGRPGVAVVWHSSWAEGPEPTQTAVITHDAAGAVVMVVGGGKGRPSESELIALAASIAPTDQATWAAFVAEQAGGPGVRPADGATELARGTVDGQEWLLQTHQADPDLGGSDLTAAERLEADPCLRLANARQVCADDNISGPIGSGHVYLHDTEMVQDPSEPAGFPSFVVVTTDAPGTALVVTQPGGVVGRGDLHALPGVDRAGGVVFLEDASPMFMCGSEPVPQGWMRVEVVDASGAVVACLGTP